MYALVRRIISPTDLMLAYNVPAFGSFVPSKHVDGFEDRALSEKAAKDAEEFLIGLARARGRNKKVSAGSVGGPRRKDVCHARR